MLRLIIITTTVAGNVTKLYQYSQDGNLLQAEVDGLVTTFAYDGNGQRLQLSVAGEATTFMPDYSGRSNRVLFEQGLKETKQYLYGAACLGEYVTDNATNDTEWRYYQRDGRTLVRQTTNQTATITLAWTFSPEGGVVLGEEGPVTHLGCQDDAVYDWSTGLIFKSGRYFDPSLGIWLTGPFMIIVGSWLPRKRRKGRKGTNDWKQFFMLVMALLLVTVPLTGCGDSTPSPTPTQTCTATPVPGQPSETSNPIAPTESSTPTETSTSEPLPTETSTSEPLPTETSTSEPLPTTTPTPSRGTTWKPIDASIYLQRFLGYTGIAQSVFNIMIHDNDDPYNSELFGYEISKWVLLQEHSSFHPSNYPVGSTRETHFSVRGLYTAATLTQVIYSREAHSSRYQNNIFEWIQNNPRSGQFAYPGSRFSVNPQIEKDYQIIAYLIEQGSLPDFLVKYPGSGAPIFYGHWDTDENDETGDYRGYDSLSVSSWAWAEKDWLPSLDDFCSTPGVTCPAGFS